MGCRKLHFDYYPFGWKLPGRNQQGSEGYRYSYQGQFAEEDKETGWNQFELRMWDGRIGRWMTTDPAGEFTSPYKGMGNIPTLYTDTRGDTIKIGYLRLGINIPNLTTEGKRADSYHTVLYHINNHTGNVTYYTEAGEEQIPKLYITTNYGKLHKNEIVGIKGKYRLTKLDVVPVPKGMSEEQFLQNIKHNSNLYANDVDYYPIPKATLKFDGNSNSFIGSILRKSGSDYKPLKGLWAPGWFIDIPLPEIIDSPIPNKKIPGTEGVPIDPDYYKSDHCNDCYG